MAERNVILEGPVKFRLKKKWKSRWCILKKLSPVADQLHISLYKDAHNCRDGHEKANIPLEDFFGVECGTTLEKESHVMAILCRKQVLFLAFPTREALRLWEATIRTELGEDRQFPVCLVKGPKEARLPLGKVKLCIQGQNLCIVTLGHCPPEVLSSWHVTDLRRFGVIDDKFCFEGGSQCGDKGAGVHVFLTEHGEEINRLLQQASQKRLSRANSSATCRRSVQVSQRETTFRSCSAYLDWTHIYPDTDHLYEGHNGLRSSQLEQNDTSSDEIDADYRCEVEEQKLRSIDRWNRERLNTIYSTSSCPDCNSCYSHVGNISSLTVGGSTVEVTRSVVRNTVSVTESTHSGQLRLSVGCAGESKDSRSVASSDSDDVFTTAESDYYNIQPPTVDYYNILPQQGGTCNLPPDSPASCSNFLSRAPRGETVHQSKPQSVILRSVKSVAYRNKRNRIVHRSHTLPRTIHECRTDIYPPDSPGCLSNDTSSRTSNKVVDDTVDTLSEDFQAYRVGDYEHVHVYDAVSDTCGLQTTSSFQDVLDDSVKSRPVFNEDSEPCGPTMALPSFRANTSMASHAYGAARVCSNSNESPYMNLSVPQNKPRAPCGLQAQEAHSGEVRIDPLRPLEYIDLNRFDGVDETYSCWLRGKSETPPPTLPPPPPPPVHGDSQERRSSVGGQGNSPHGTPTRSIGGKVELPKKRLQKANRFLSFHGSLKRQTKSKSSSEKSLPDDGSCRRSHSMHSGKLPRCSSFGHTLPRPGSVNCVSHTSAAILSVANSASESGGLPPRPTRAPSMQSVSEYLTPSLPSNSGNNAYQSSSSQQNLCTSTRSDYMMMDPSSTTTVTVTSNTVFCTVDLPLKRTNSAGGRSRNASFSGSNSGAAGGGKVAGYFEMSQVDATKAMGRSMSMRENAGISPPPLHHSKSWGDELESNYLQMNCSTADDYIKMSPTDMDRLSHAQQSEIRPLKPFDNLLEHKHHLHRKPIATPRAPPFRDTVDRMGSDSKPSSDEDSSCKTSNGKTQGLLSRLIRRNSSKKASRSQEDILTATAIETVPEVCQMNTISHVRTKSADMLDDAPPRSTPERQRSMSYSDMSRSRYGLAEQKPRSLLFAVPPAPGAQSDAGLFVSVPPPVPPRAPGGSTMSLAGGRTDAATYVTVAAVSTDTGEYFTVGRNISAVSTARQDGPYVSTGYTPRISTTTSDSNGARCDENHTPRGAKPNQSQTMVQQTTLSTCPTRQSELSRSGDNSPEGDYLMVWADSSGKSSGDSAVVLPSRSSTAFDRPPRRSCNSSEMYTHAPSGASVMKTDPIPIPTPQARLNEDEHSCSSASPPALPEKTYRRASYSRGYLALPARRRTINLSEATPTDSPSHSCYSSDAESVCLPAKTAAEKMKHIPSLRVSIPSLTIPRHEEQDGIWMHRYIAPMQEEVNYSRSTANGPTSYEGVETMSVMSHGSSDTPSSVRSDELKSCTSPASTTLRPRSGKEYQKLDRRKLAEDLNIPIEELLTPKSPSVSSSVFTFDSAVVSLRASPASAYSCGDDSPSMLTQRYGCVNHTDSLRSSETSPPGSCMSLAGNPDINEEALLNYAEIDLSDSEASRPPCRSGNEIEYAIIDMVATVTASRVGKEHAQLREDKLQQNVQRQDSGKERELLVTRRAKEKRFSSMNSRDKKLSLTSIISSNSKGKKSSL